MKLRERDTIGGKTEKPQTPGMVRDVIDYVRTLEDRIQRLEAAKDNDSGNDKSETDKTETKKIEPDKVETGEGKPEEEGDKKEESDDPKSIIEDVKFFHTAGEFDSNGSWKDNSKAKGSYQCNTDPLHRMRVLCDWIPGSRPPTDMESPDPDGVDVLAFGIVSAPINAFFRFFLRINIGSTKSLQFEKPFRPLIHNVQKLRDQLAKLEERER